MHGHPPGSIWPAGNTAAVELREVYARYGLAMSQAQVLEHTVVNTAIFFHFIPTIGEYSDIEAWQNALESSYDAEFAKTFGNMLNSLSLIPDLPADLMQRLRSAKADRDHLAHGFFREHDLDITTSSGRTKMIAKCEEIIHRFNELDHEIEVFASPQYERFGITSEIIERALQKLMSEENHS